MRFTSTRVAVAATALLFGGGAALAQDQCTCPPPSSGGSSGANQWTGSSSSGNSNNQQGSISAGWTPPTSYEPAPAIQEVPKIKATPQTIENGTKKAIDQLTNQNILPPDVAQEIQQAINDAIAKHNAPQPVVVQVPGNNQDGTPTTSTVTVTPSATVVPSTITVDGGVSTVFMTQTITALPPGATILPNATLNALNSIEDAIRDAIAAVNLSKTGLDANAQGELQHCLNAVLENGGLPEGYSCISQSGSTSGGLKSTFNNILEQFLGILPAKIIDEIQDAVMPMMTDLLPDEKTLLNNINSAMSSVVASLSGNSVSAIEMMQSCYSLAIKQNGNSSYLQCYMSNGGPFDTLQTAMNSVIQQFVGYLPGTLLESVQNLTSSTLKAGANSDLSSIGTNLTSQLDNALSSVTSSLTGNAVTLMNQLQQCANLVLKDGNADAAKACMTQAPAQTAQNMVVSVSEQFSGYLPSSFFSDLVSILDKEDTSATGGNFTKTQLVTALDGAFNNANMGPAFVGCFHQVQDCVLATIQATGNTGATCPGPVAGCELIGSNNSTGLANTTMDSMLSASASSSLAAATSTIVAADNSTSVAATATDAASSAASTASVFDSSSSPIAAMAASASSASAPASSEVASPSAAPASSSSSVPASSAPASSVEVSSSSSSEAPVSSSAPASSAPASSSAASSAPAPGGETATATGSPASGAGTRQKMVKRKATAAAASHKNLRRMYAEHYGKLQ